jgi:hypothetical protein
MNGGETMTVWLFALFCAAVSVCSVAKSFASARSEVARQHARAHVEAHRVVAEGQFGRVIVPPEWQEEGL